ncbi:fe-s assembly co-chaperone protein [Rutstroemia sp. NJR-2017a BVV2]|nr:fe-s assembly co-chaperone protein [Rutstroemia sp. NJR-2017a BVV2]PQE18489.1 fe-s assembly co-chaperone protein [Rutstroemia sp. NJR-2017a BVV2]
MRSSLAPKSVLRSCRIPYSRTSICRAAPPICQTSHQRNISAPHTPPSNHRFTSTTSATTTTTNAQEPSQTSTPSPPRNHYDLFPLTFPNGPPPASPFKVDPRTLRNEFLRLQATAHPDRHTSTTSKTRAEATSALINDAYKTLLSPLLRAQYLLSLRGIDVAGDETGKVDDAELLMEVLETREEIEDAEQEEDLQGLRERNEKRIEEAEEVLERMFAEDDLEGARREAVRLRYWINIKESLHAWEKGKPVVLVH